MGNQSSISSASISIATDKLQYIAGETVEGYVEVNVVETTSASELFVIFEGKAKTCVGYDVQVVKNMRHKHGPGVDDKVTERRHARRQREVISKEILVASFSGGTIQPGRYQFKFAFALPGDLPGSCHVKRNDHYGEISYYLKVKMNRPGITKKNLVARAMVNLDSKAPEISEITVEDESQVNTCCCFNNGVMTLKCTVPQDVFNAGEEMEVHVDLDNSSTKPAGKIHLQMVEKVFIQAQGHKQMMNEVLASRQAEGCAPRASRSFSTMFAAPPAERMRQSSPLDFGDMIRVSHVLVVQATTGPFISNPSIRIPIYGRRMGQLMLSDNELEEVKVEEEAERQAKAAAGARGDADDDDNEEATLLPVAVPVAYAPNAAYASIYQVESAYSPGHRWD